MQIDPSLSSNSYAKSSTRMKQRSTPELAVASRRKLVGGDGVAGKDQGSRAHPGDSLARPKVARVGLAMRVVAVAGGCTAGAAAGLAGLGGQWLEAARRCGDVRRIWWSG